MTVYHTEQGVYDFVLAKIREQGKVSIYQGRCLYRAPNGDRCSIGHLIPDHVYDQEMEGSNYDMMREQRDSNTFLAEHYYRIRALFHPEVRDNFLIALQYAHDHSRNSMQLFENRMKNLAVRFDLTYTPPVAA